MESGIADRGEREAGERGVMRTGRARNGAERGTRESRERNEGRVSVRRRSGNRGNSGDHWER